MPTPETERAALGLLRARRLVEDYLRRPGLPFPQQEAMVRDNRRLVSAFCGIQSGKTQGGERLALRRIWAHVCRLREDEFTGARPVWRPLRAVPMARDDEPAAHYWITAGTETLSLIAWRKFISGVRAAGLPILRYTDGALWLPAGVLCEPRTGSDEGQMQGAKLDGAWVDEACEYPEASWDQVKNRLTIKRGWSILTGSPRPGTWPKRRIWDEGESEDVGIHHWFSRDNPYMEPAEIEHARRTMPAKWFRRDYEATWETDEGVVYDEFAWAAAPAGNLVPLSVVRGPGIRWWGCVDFGIRRPAILLCATVPGLASDGGPADVVVDEVVLADRGAPERIGRELADLADRHRARLAAVYCDPAGNARTGAADLSTSVQAMREALRARGHEAPVYWPTTPARKSIAAGIVTVAGRILAADGVRRLFVVDELDRRKYPAGLVGICGSLRGYAWDAKRPGAGEPRKDGVHDHGVDALRYGLVCLHGVAGEVRQSFAPADPLAVARERRAAY